MTRCPECDAALDSMTELARHECEPTYPTAEEVKRVKAAPVDWQPEAPQPPWIEQAWQEYYGR